MLAVFLLAPALIVGQDSRDLLSQYAGKRTAMLFQTIPGSPFGGSGGGAPFQNPYPSLFTFGSAVAAADSIAFNETAGCFTGEGAGVDAFEIRVCLAAINADAQLDIGAEAAGTVRISNGSGALALQSQSSSVSISAISGLTLSGGTQTTFSDDSEFDAAVLFDGNTAVFQKMEWNTTQTPDTFVAAVGTNGRSISVIESGDEGFDFTNGPCGTSACTNPQVIVHGSAQNTTNFQAHGVNGLSGRFVKTLTEATPTSVVIIPVAAATSVSGQMLYTVHARDATNSQTRSGRIIYNGVAEGTTATCVIGTAEELDNTPTGTLTAAITCTSPVNNQIQLLINAASSLTQTTLEAYVMLIHVGAGEPLPQ